MAPSKTLERILNEAIILFNENGVSSVTTNHIADKLGISPGNLYYHFKNKEAIIRAIFSRMAEEMNAVWIPTDNKKPRDSLDSIRFVLEKSYLLMWEYRFFQRDINTLLRKDPELAKLYQKIRKQRWAEIDSFFRSLVDTGILKQSLDSKTLSNLSKIGWMITDYWLAFLDAEGRSINRKSAQQGVDLIMTLIKPYLSDKTKSQIK
jgi:AcrR family transcriptional regulator